MRANQLATLIVVFALSVSLAGRAMPQTDAKPLPPLGLGIEPCATWLQHHAARDDHAFAEDEWFAGFLSGYNKFTDPRTRAATFLPYDRPVLSSAITSQCGANPALDVYSAALRFLSLQKRRK